MEKIFAWIESNKTLNGYLHFLSNSNVDKNDQVDQETNKYIINKVNR